MSANAVHVRLTPVADADLPTCRLYGNVPVVSWREGAWADVELTLGNHPDPADYLRRLAHTLSAFAADVDAARDEHEPGRRSPYPPSGNGGIALCNCDGAFDDRRAAEMGN